MPKDGVMERFLARINAPERRVRRRLPTPMWIAEVAPSGEKFGEWHLLTSIAGGHTKQPGVICMVNTRTMNWTAYDRPQGTVCRCCAVGVVTIYGKNLDKETRRVLKKSEEDRHGKRVRTGRSAKDSQ